jgi:hypothetical protein
MRSKFSAALAGLAVLLCSGCNGSPGQGCAASISNPAPELAFPAPGATGVSASAGELLVAGAAPGENAITVASPAGPLSNIGTLVQPAATPFPAGAPTPQPYGYFESVSLPALRAATTYTVSSTVPNTCASGSHVVQIGSFTTR